MRFVFKKYLGLCKNNKIIKVIVGFFFAEHFFFNLRVPTSVCEHIIISLNCLNDTYINAIKEVLYLFFFRKIVNTIVNTISDVKIGTFKKEWNILPVCTL